jgi:hypothetical protein
VRTIFHCGADPTQSFGSAAIGRNQLSETRHSVTSHLCARRLAKPLSFAGVFLIASAASPAWAYLDPGTGSMMLQLMLGGVAGVLVVGKLYLKRATDFFRHLGRRRRTG